MSFRQFSRRRKHDFSVETRFTQLNCKFNTNLPQWTSWHFFKIILFFTDKFTINEKNVHRFAKRARDWFLGYNSQGWMIKLEYLFARNAKYIYIDRNGFVLFQLLERGFVTSATVCAPRVFFFFFLSFISVSHDRILFAVLFFFFFFLVSFFIFHTLREHTACDTFFSHTFHHHFHIWMFQCFIHSHTQTYKHHSRAYNVKCVFRVRYIFTFLTRTENDSMNHMR